MQELGRAPRGSGRSYTRPRVLPRTCRGGAVVVIFVVVIVLSLDVFSPSRDHHFALLRIRIITRLIRSEDSVGDTLIIDRLQRSPRRASPPPRRDDADA